MPVQPHTYSAHAHIKKWIPFLDVYLRNSSDVCVTVFSFQKHSNNKEGKVCHLVHQLFCFYLIQWMADDLYYGVWWLVDLLNTMGIGE